MDRTGRVAAVLILLAIAACSGRIGIAGQDEQGTVAPADTAEWSEIAARLRSHPHYQRVQVQIASAAERTEEELIKALDQQWVVFYSGASLSSQIKPERHFQFVLADRNIRRLDELLGCYPAAERCERIHQLYEIAWQRYVALAEDVFSTLDKPEPVSQDDSERPKARPYAGRLVAVLGTIFLAAKYCDAESVERMLKPFFDYSAALPARLDAKPYATESVESAMPEAFLPDKAFLLNILIFAVERDTNFDKDRRRDAKRGILRARQTKVLKTTNVELGKWNAEVDWFDLAMFKAGPKFLDRRGGIEVIPFQEWTGGEQARDELIATPRRILSRRS